VCSSDLLVVTFLSLEILAIFTDSPKGGYTFATSSPFTNSSFASSLNLMIASSLNFEFSFDTTILKSFLFEIIFDLNVGCAYCTHFKYWNYYFKLVHGGLEFLLFFKIHLGFAFDFQQYSEWQQPVGAVSLTKVKISL
jgi:hypothetical protein